jgi:hypothetical protein
MGHPQVHQDLAVVDEKYTRVRMLQVSGKNAETQWFTYRPGFFSEIITVEWEIDSMEIDLPSVDASALIAKGYAKLVEDKS